MLLDTFGNLRDWGLVMEKLEGLRTAGELDQHQEGLIRILRYRGNWRLRETVLRCVHEVRTPCDELLAAVLSIMKDDDVYYEARLLAAESLAAVSPTVEGAGAPEPIFTRCLVSREIEELLRMPAPPFFHDSLRRVRESLE